ncbi:MAG: bifunctional YncE family protein/alkaline phosphatase family protein [Actinobacteria bacterium]|nr:bifunctional YncE family protein/alkaline phosphatase family protein [Actinomycetota bacterium]
MNPLARRGSLLVLLVVAVAAAVGVARAVGLDVNAVGPVTRIQPDGRRLSPPGVLTKLGNHPGGGQLTPNGRFLWTISAGRGRNDVRIVRVQPLRRRACKRRKVNGHPTRVCHTRTISRVGQLIQVIPMPGANGGMTFAADGRTAYVSGTPESPHKDQQSPASTPGKKGDVIHVFRYDPTTGKASRTGLIPVPPPSGTGTPQALPEQGLFPVGPPYPQDFPPTNTKPMSWPRDLAVTHDGRTLLAALNLADRAAIVDTRTGAVRYVKVGSYPYGAAITRDGKGLVSNESDGTVSVIDLASGAKLTDIQVGAHLSHPEGIAVDPASDRAFVAVANQDRVTEIDTKAMTVKQVLSLEQPQGLGSSPTAVSVDARGCYLTVSQSGEDDVVVYSLRSRCGPPKPSSSRTHGRGRRVGAARVRVTAASTAIAPRLLGRVPTAAYPVGAGITPDARTLAWVSAKGLGVGPNPNGPDPLSKLDSDDHINSFQYLPSIVDGLSGVLPLPSPKRLRTLDKRALADLLPADHEKPPPGTPILPPDVPGGNKIQHVFYIVKENRTYDQVLGDDARGNGDPKLTLFGSKLTPNTHALARRFPLLDHVFANSEASIDGHFWTSAAAVSDYVVKNWHQNYAGRGRPYDFGVYAVTWPGSRFIFDRAIADGVSFFNYGEAIAGDVPLTDKDRTPAENAAVQQKFSKSDLGSGVTGPLECYPNDASIGTDAINQREAYDSSLPAGAPPGSESRFSCFQQHLTEQLATGSVPALSYLVLPSDHTQILSPGRRTPQAMIAENDYALGEIVQEISSHTSLWDHSLILVLEDDSQDGADHLDAHRIPALAISPYAKKGAVVHARYDFPSFIRTLEIPLGMHPMNIFDALATPLYDAFTSTPANDAPYTAIAPNVNINARNPNTAANRRLMRGVDVRTLDQVTQKKMDQLLWYAVHGVGSTPPKPGPGAVNEHGRTDGD